MASLKKTRGKSAGAPPPEPPPEGHASDQELFDLECGEPMDRPPASPTLIAARRRIYNLGRAHGRAEALKGA